MAFFSIPTAGFYPVLLSQPQQFPTAGSAFRLSESQVHHQRQHTQGHVSTQVQRQVHHHWMVTHELLDNIHLFTSFAVMPRWARPFHTSQPRACYPLNVSQARYAPCSTFVVLISTACRPLDAGQRSRSTYAASSAGMRLARPWLPVEQMTAEWRRRRIARIWSVKGTQSRTSASMSTDSSCSATKERSSMSRRTSVNRP